ncbi:prolipoprotein diacylglyceryl transferase [Sphingobacterium mizutaii NBRC 14946 = DSM 11724]|uniref:Phosphatidylglycerol--prolipoprotein diacylglyceryl transferase n=2 Tax=Sphingobacterium mizutaii TaxID=1010 RepID=A0AAJ4XE26_9SPHI|nr:prolipoprotein diacylglyceryl transferase [Sphingobacterium mizutaii]GEM68134.1 prolipoprotein diacylglyceryl transferase [Sphingobacterium mizutaii NBRC 14946 = DSM 11724]SDL28287.1 prolipoprotein diacylglyceryl transferase [Sphingobacterium mizutaii]SNV53759.1 Prolipoprotein diacylglyceryl transferase [Sphingobacterium mizutaii]
MLDILSFITWGPEPEIFKIGSFGVRWYSLCWLLAFVVSYFLMLKIFKREGKSQELLDKLTIYIFIGTLVGARLGHCFFYDWAYYKEHFLEIFIPFQKINGSWELTGFTGLASHGGAIGILIALWLFSRNTKTNFMWITDRLILVVPIAGAFIRLGNFFNSEMIGNPSNLPWAVIFTHEDQIPRHPAQMYEAIAYVIIFIILWAMYQKNKDPKPGKLFGIFLILLFGARFIIEYVKIDQVAFEAGMLLNMGQILSIPFILLGIFLLVRKPKETKKA